ncbi:MAG: patatin-like phospholipase family protein, partial [Muribaculaceae bacterium]|nr:patatin-like phospholipase family protein [Muribaculaceae bacterium]
MDKVASLRKISCLFYIIAFMLTGQSLSAREKVGLVLSGGGAKGIAHVGVIKALEDNDIPIDYVTGTSMGAIVGSLYSCGWSPERMMDMFSSQDFRNWSTGTVNKNLEYYLNTPTPTPKWLSLNINFKDSTNNLMSQIIPTSLVNPIPMNIEFLEIFSPYSDQCKGNFNNLFVPFRCVTSDVYSK